MSLDTLIFVLVILAIIFSNLFKILKKTAQTGTIKAGAPSGWKKALSDLIAQIREEMRKAAEPATGEKPPGRTTGWEQVMGPLPPREEGRPDKRGMKDTPKVRQTFKEVIQKSYPPKPGPEVPRPGEPAFAAGMAGAAEGPECKKAAMMINRRNLRRAVIWSEILGKPVGLRDLEE